jgi:fructose/tagatose bisphosphate aldolase
LIRASGAYKFKGNQGLHFDVIEAIERKLPGTPLVMHGSSSMPAEDVQRINSAGAKLDPTGRGVNENEYLPAAKLGVTKINIVTDGRLVWTRVASGIFSRSFLGIRFFALRARRLFRNTRNLSRKRMKN